VPNTTEVITELKDCLVGSSLLVQVEVLKLTGVKSLDSGMLYDRLIRPINNFIYFFFILFYVMSDFHFFVEGCICKIYYD